MTRRLGAVLLAVGCLVATLWALDWAIDRWDLGYEAARSHANDDRMLTRPEYSVRVVTNALGFRERRLPGPKPPGTRRVVALGDSFTAGYGVEEAEAYPHLLEMLLGARDPAHRWEVINLGVPGTNPRDYLGILRTVGVAYQPDVVLVGVMANDVYDIRIQQAFGTQFSSGVLVQAQQEIDHPRPWWKTVANDALPSLYPFVWTRVARLNTSGPRQAVAATPDTAHRMSLPPDRWRDVLLAFADRFDRRAAVAAALSQLPEAEIAPMRPLLTGDVALDAPEAADPYFTLLGLVEPELFVDAVLLPPSYDAAWAKMARVLGLIDHTARAAGARTVIAFIPAAHQVTDSPRPFLTAHHFAWDDRTLTDTTFADRLRALGDARGVTTVDLLGTCRAQPNRRELYYPEDGHWTPTGHRLAAGGLVGAIDR